MLAHTIKAGIGSPYIYVILFKSGNDNLQSFLLKNKNALPGSAPLNAFGAFLNSQKEKIKADDSKIT